MLGPVAQLVVFHHTLWLTDSVGSLRPCATQATPCTHRTSSTAGPSTRARRACAHAEDASASRRGLSATVPGAELSVYPALEYHLAERDAQAAARLRQRVLAFPS